MRYAHRGGLTAEERKRRERLRREAAELFAQGVAPVEVARRFKVTRMSTSRWYRAWKDGGTQAPASAGPGGEPCRLAPRQLARLQAELKRGPAAHGWVEDQRWTLARVAELIARPHHVRYTPRGVSYLLHRRGWSPQVPAHRAAERDEEVIEQRVAQTWPRVQPHGATRAPGCAGKMSPARGSGRRRPAPGRHAGRPHS